MSEVEAEFLLISEAVTRLEAGMFGGDVRRPQAVVDAKKHYPKASIGWGLRKQSAAKTVDAAIQSGKLSLYTFGASERGGMVGPIRVPLEVVARMIRARAGLPDHMIRPSVDMLRDKLVTAELFSALSNSALYLRRSEFDVWYDDQANRRRWSSQRKIKKKTKKAPIGAPSKQTDELLTSIIARVEEGSWTAKDGIAKLATLLISRGAPKRNTLRRAVDQIHIETGDFGIQSSLANARIRSSRRDVSSKFVAAMNFDR